MKKFFTRGLAGLVLLLALPEQAMTFSAFQQARALYIQGQDSRAAKILFKKKSLRSLEELTLAARIALRLGKFDSALKYAREGLRLKPTDPVAMVIKNRCETALKPATPSRPTEKPTALSLATLSALPPRESIARPGVEPVAIMVNKTVNPLQIELKNQLSQAFEGISNP